MSIEPYQTWARGLDAAPDSHRPHDAATRLQAEGVIDIAHEPKFVLPRTTSIFGIGSCFARNIEDALVAKKYNVNSAKLTLPSEGFGGNNPRTVLTKFNTHSMLTELQVAFEGRALPDDGLIEMREGLFWNPQLHRVGFVPREMALEVKATVAETVKTIAQSDLVIITLGLTEYWFDKELEVPLNDAPVDWRHARKTNRFEFRNSNYGDSLEQVLKLRDLIFERGTPNTKIVLTVSPVPLLRTFSNQDIVVANSFSKSTLRAIAQEVSSSDDRVDYFPSYEIVTNSPRATTWKHDMRHVEFPVIQQVVAKFEQLYFEQK
jgi:hypothetical protein